MTKTRSMTAGLALVAELRGIVGSRALYTSPAQMRRFTTGHRFGEGPVVAVVRPRTLIELWHTLRACTAAGVIIIMQSANTGLTGGSTPNGEYGRDVILINTMRIKGIYPISDGRQVVCLPGATLHELETSLAPLGREPHSVIGSSCIGASVFGGICNNSGGSLVQRGPAYTELALYARIDEKGSLRLVNHLGMTLGDDPLEILRRVEKGDFLVTEIDHDNGRRASDHGYCDHVRAVGESTPARFNADPGRLYEASGSAGKLALLAVRLDTFPKDPDSATFYIGTNDAGDLADIRMDILERFENLPISAEYIHRDAFDLADRYGKDMVIAIERLGTRRLPMLFAAKARIDAIGSRVPFVPAHLSDRLMQVAGYLFRDHLPERMRHYRNRYEHHLVLKMGGTGIEEARRYLGGRYPSPAGGFFECSPLEAKKAFLHRFAVAGAAIRYRAIHSDEVEDIIAIDVALRRNDRDWFETLPADIERGITNKVYYGHFLCNVFHQDYIVAKNFDPAELEHQMHEILDRRGAEYPAEHNVGHLYKAKPSLVRHYQALDPSNSFNPGIGATSRAAYWRD